MKKLFLSLLRAGDFIMQRPLLKDQLQHNEVHVLVNDEFQQLQELYPEFKFHFFPRRQLQDLVNQPHSSLLKPFEVLRHFVEDLNAQAFDEIVNLTHNRLSAYLMDQLRTPEKRGLEFVINKFQTLDQPWQRYFNEVFSQNQRSAVHYLTALSRSLNLPVPRMQAAEDRSQSNLIYLQVFTSDEKKNWSLHKWMALHELLLKNYPQFQFKVLAAPFEVEKIKKFFNPQHIEIVSLSEARQRLSQARLLITGDTSLAHLAAETRTPNLVLSLGSSDCSKTAPWLHGSWILTSNIACAPCPHSKPCSQATHICGEELKVSSVLSVFKGIEQDRHQFGLLSSATLYRTEYDINHIFKLTAYSSIGGLDAGKNPSTVPAGA